MNIDDFSEGASGSLVQAGGGNVEYAFLPDPLPPAWEWPEHLWPLLRDAHIALASLDGVGRYLPNPDLLLHPLQQREAQQSSRLEGTYTDPEQQMLFQLDPTAPDSEEDPRNEFKEVYNYKRALQLQDSTDLPLSLRLIRRLHEVLMEDVRGADRQPGQFRQVQNLIGKPPRYVPPPPNRLEQCLDEFEHHIHAEHGFDPLVEAFLLHYQLEAIHPFRDGNGRVGRLLLSIMIADWCDLSHQWLYMSAFFNRHGDEYIDRLYAVSADADWEGWIEFCLNGVIEQAEDTEDRCDRLVELNSEFHNRVEAIGGSHRLGMIVDDLFNQPVVQITTIRDRYDVHYNTAKADVEKLFEAGILAEFADASVRTFAATEIIDATAAD